MKKQILLKIYGEVQGVFFRAYTKDKAKALNLDGWVKNMPDGTVEILLVGESEKIDEMIAWCHEGSPEARVEKVEKKEVNFHEENLSDFEIRY